MGGSHLNFTQDPAELPGHVALPPSRCSSALLADPTWRALLWCPLTHPSQPSSQAAGQRGGSPDSASGVNTASGRLWACVPRSRFTVPLLHPLDTHTCTQVPQVPHTQHTHHRHAAHVTHTRTTPPQPPPHTHTQPQLMLSSHTRVLKREIFVWLEKNRQHRPADQPRLERRGTGAPGSPASTG